MSETASLHSQQVLAEPPVEGGHAPSQTIAIAILVSGLTIFALIAWAVTNGWTQSWDEALLLSLRDSANVNDPLGPDWFEEAAAEVTALGGYTILVMIALVAITVLYLLAKKSAALFLFGSLVGGSLVSTLLKQVFDRPRPDIVEHADKVFTSSFPSAHAMFGTLAWMTLAAIAIRFIPRRGVRMFVLWGAAVLTLLISLSRVYLGVHWPTDVIAGWSLGICWAVICWSGFHMLAHDKHHIGRFGHSE